MAVKSGSSYKTMKLSSLLVVTTLSISSICLPRKSFAFPASLTTTPPSTSRVLVEGRSQRTGLKMSSNGVTTYIVEIEKPDDVNVIVGMTHFIKTVDDIHEAMVGTVPGIKFGLGFCEASGHRLVRWTGTDERCLEIAKSNAQAIACGHSFILVLGAPTFPIHILKALKDVPEVCHIFCATQNRLQLIVAETEAGRGIMGVIDGQPPLGIEDAFKIEERRNFLKTIGYKL